MDSQTQHLPSIPGSPESKLNRQLCIPASTSVSYEITSSGEGSSLASPSSSSDYNPSTDGDETEVLKSDPPRSTGKQRSDTDNDGSLPARLAQVQWTQQDARAPGLSLREVRKSLCKSFPELSQPPQQPRKVKITKPNAPPPALLPKQHVVTDKERARRENSLAVRLEFVDDRTVVKGAIALEKRSYQWLPIDDAGMNASSNFPNELPSPWLAPIDSSQLLQQSRDTPQTKLYLLPSYTRRHGCKSCKTSGLRRCGKCQGLETQECFGCAGEGYRRSGRPCEVCHATGVYQCGSCNNKGQLECKRCTGKGQVSLGLFVQVKIKFVHLDAIRVKALLPPGADLSDFDAVRIAAEEKILAAADKIRRDAQREAKATFDAYIPVMAQGVLEQSVVRTYSVLKPMYTNAKDWPASMADATPADTAGEGEDPPIFTFEGLDPKLAVEKYMYQLSSVADAKLQEVHTSRDGSSLINWSRLGSDSASYTPVQSVPGTPSGSRSPYGVASLSRRTSVANLQALSRQCARQRSFLSIPGTPFTPPKWDNPSPSGRGDNTCTFQDENAAKLFEALQKFQLESVKNLQKESKRPTLDGKHRNSIPFTFMRRPSSFRKTSQQGKRSG